MLCPTHKGQRFSPATGRCQTCPNSVPNRNFKICYRCSATRNECQVCRASLTPGQTTHPHGNDQTPTGK